MVARCLCSMERRFSNDELDSVSDDYDWNDAVLAKVWCDDYQYGHRLWITKDNDSSDDVWLSVTCGEGLLALIRAAVELCHSAGITLDSGYARLPVLIEAATGYACVNIEDVIASNSSRLNINPQNLMTVRDISYSTIYDRDDNDGWIRFMSTYHSADDDSPCAGCSPDCGDNDSRKSSDSGFSFMNGGSFRVLFDMEKLDGGMDERLFYFEFRAWVNRRRFGDSPTQGDYIIGPFTYAETMNELALSGTIMLTDMMILIAHIFDPCIPARVLREDAREWFPDYGRSDGESTSIMAFGDDD